VKPEAFIPFSLGKWTNHSFLCVSGHNPGKDRIYIQVCNSSHSLESLLKANFLHNWINFTQISDSAKLKLRTLDKLTISRAALMLTSSTMALSGPILIISCCGALIGPLNIVRSLAARDGSDTTS